MNVYGSSDQSTASITVAGSAETPREFTKDLMNLEANLKELSTCISMLFNRLNVVLSPNTPKSEDEAEKMPSVSALSERIIYCDGHVRLDIKALNEILTRLEI